MTTDAETLQIMRMAKAIRESAQFNARCNELEARYHVDGNLRRACDEIMRRLDCATEPIINCMVGLLGKFRSDPQCHETLVLLTSIFDGGNDRPSPASFTTLPLGERLMIATQVEHIIDGCSLADPNTPAPPWLTGLDDSMNTLG